MFCGLYVKISVFLDFFFPEFLVFRIEHCLICYLTSYSDSCFNLHLLPLILSLCTTMHSLALHCWPPHRYGKAANMCPWNPLCPTLKQIQFSQLFLVWQVLQFSDCPHDPSMDSFQLINSFLILMCQKSDAAWSLTSTETRKIITSFLLIPSLLLLQLVILWASASRACCCLMSNGWCGQPGAPGSFL